MTGKRWGESRHCLRIPIAALVAFDSTVLLKKIVVRVCVLFPFLKRLRNVFVTCRDYDPLDSPPPPETRNISHFREAKRSFEPVSYNTHK
jgi:hypothetical protein